MPVGFLEEIIEARVFAAAVAANEADHDGWRSSPMRTLATEIEHELADEEITHRT